MNGFTPYEKLSKRRRKELDRVGRGTWGAISPVTKRPERSDAYKRHEEKANTLKLARCRNDDYGDGSVFIREFTAITRRGAHCASALLAARAV